MFCVCVYIFLLGLHDKSHAIVMHMTYAIYRAALILTKNVMFVLKNFIILSAFSHYFIVESPEIALCFVLQQL